MEQGFLDFLRQKGINDEEIIKMAEQIENKYREELEKKEQMLKEIQSKAQQTTETNPYDAYLQMMQLYQQMYQQPQYQYQPQQYKQASEEFDWESLYADENYGRAWKTIKQYLDRYNETISQYNRMLSELLADYVNSKTAFAEYINKLEFERLRRERYSKDKEKFKYLPEPTIDELRKIAREKKIDSWEGAYEAWLANQVPTVLEALEKERSTQQFKEATKPNLPPPTEVQSQNTPVVEKPEESKVTYIDGWKKLREEFEKLAI